MGRDRGRKGGERGNVERQRWGEIEGERKGRGG